MYKLYSFKGFAFSGILISGLLIAGNISGQNPSSKKTTTGTAKGSAKNGYSIKWQVNPVDNKIFIQNSGQFDGDANSNGKIFYQARLGNIQAYFTGNGVIYRYNGNARDKSDARFLPVEWENANPGAFITAEQEQSYYYSYPKGVDNSVKASVYKKIVYHNLYPGIDVEYTFPASKEGIKYALIVHPGADISAVKLKYTDANGAHMDGNGNIIVTTPIGEFTDHAPVSFYNKGGSVNVSYQLNGTTESFAINGAFNKSATLVIDPWTTNPNFTAPYNSAYDVDYDNNGNVYAYGGYDTTSATHGFQLVKFNSVGVIQWKFIASSIDDQIYGDFAVDKTTGTSYIIEGAHATGARALKVNTLGNLKATFPGQANVIEMWRAVFDPCNHTLVIGAGDNNNTLQACTLDTNMTTLNPVNVLGAASPGHTMALTAIDPSGDTCYMATAKSAQVDTSNYNNVLVKMPLSSLSPTMYDVPDGYNFAEIGISYVGPGVNHANGMNGMAVSPDWLYMSDGSTLKQVNKITGAVVNSTSISATAFAWGGLAADICDNVYAGSNSSIKIYSSALVLQNTIALKDIVYAVVLGPDESVLYAGGMGYVSAINITSPLTFVSTPTPTQCGCNGSANVSLSSTCTIDTANLSYLWSDGQTTQTAINLCAQTYSVTISSYCSVLYQGTVDVSTHFMSMNIPSASICTGGNGVTLAGTGALFYKWSPATGLSSSNSDTVVANPTKTTTYTVIGTSSSGCNDTTTVTVTVNTKPVLMVTGPSAPVCPNTPTQLVATGASGYTWNPAAPLTCDTCSITNANVSKDTTFIVIGTTGGCSDTDSVSVKVFPLPSVSIVTTPTQCDTNDGTATATVSGSGPYTYSWSPVGGTTDSATGLPAGSYVLTITDTSKCIITQSCVVKITPSPTVTATSIPSGCDTATGKAIANVIDIPPAPPYKYLWSPGGGTSDPDTKLGAGIYTVTVTDSNHCKGTAFTIVEDSGLTVNNWRNDVSCFGGSNGEAAPTVVIGTGTPPYTYSWSNIGSSTTDTVKNLSLGQYTVTVTDSNHCTSVDTVNIWQPTIVTATITPINLLEPSCFDSVNGKMSVTPGGGTPPYSYLWNTVPKQTGDTASGLATGTYSVQVTDNNGCIASASDSLPQPAPLMDSAFSSARTCGNNGSVTVLAWGGTPGYFYKWAPGGGTTASVTQLNVGIYSVIVTDAHGCIDSAKATIDSLAAIATIKAIKNELCFGGNTGYATVEVAGGDSSLYSYSWFLLNGNSGIPIGQGNATATGLTAGIDSISIEYLANGCTKWIFDTITQPPALKDTVKYTVECENKVIAVDSAWGGVPPYTYSWSPSGGSGTTATIASGSFTITVTDSNGCEAVNNYIAPTTQPVADFIPVPDTISSSTSSSYNDSIKFVNTSTGAISWYWTFGDGSSSIDSFPSHEYLYGGTYVVYLKVTNSIGCVDSIAKDIYVKEGVTVPNVFTPNGDGINDVFHVDSYGMENFKIDIYDRWGILVFEGTGPNNDWTGRNMAGETVPAGTYYYIITASDYNGKSFNQKGFLELIR
ncbi:MAG: gliding motility-associated C-terminal domain-containing protein [Bacteroidia bacterium]